jgi:hypothetical protein
MGQLRWPTKSAAEVDTRGPSPQDEMISVQVVSKRVGRHSASERIEERATDLPGPKVFPGHLQGRETPSVDAWYACRRIPGLVTRRARETDCAVVMRTASHRHDVRMAVVPLTRKARCSMAIQATSILKDRRHTEKELLRFG